jgi:hypothetical protein
MVFDPSVNDFHDAGSAGAAFAGVVDVYPVPQQGFQQRLGLPHP